MITHLSSSLAVTKLFKRLEYKPAQKHSKFTITVLRSGTPAVFRIYRNSVSQIDNIYIYIYIYRMFTNEWCSFKS